MHIKVTWRMMDLADYAVAMLDDDKVQLRERQRREARLTSRAPNFQNTSEAQPRTPRQPARQDYTFLSDWGPQERRTYKPVRRPSNEGSPARRPSTEPARRPSDEPARRPSDEPARRPSNELQALCDLITGGASSPVASQSSPTPEAPRRAKPPDELRRRRPSDARRLQQASSALEEAMQDLSDERDSGGAQRRSPT
ncbi:hypothetical protein M885DRAFT_514628 [Pelagophyceae sp. CCMP2097]|nr:hypothetical protein M885DRAFT_542412 [Pelagophyceae sp. CCMP2097]KAJ1457617.1 hypothetical protein M885DRAFT_514628 [Pelagophyceae sp. CCMP2097]